MKVSDSVDNPVKLIGTFSFSNFTANGSYAPVVSGLTRNAKRRTFFIKNGLNQNLNTITFYPTDSLSPNPSSALGTSVNILTAIPAGVQSECDNVQTPILGFAGDSFILSMAMGATAPTTGNVTVYVTEIF